MDERRMNMTHGRTPRAPEPVFRASAADARDPSSMKPGHFFKKRWWVMALGIVLLAAVIVLGYGYLTTRSQLTKLSGTGQNNAQQLTKEIGTYLQLPNETPTLATVSDVDKLKSQEFFKNAQNGDRVLIFSKAGRALLYRPSTRKVIEYSKVSFGSAQTPQSSTPQSP